jgi:hypothetical protein
MFVIIISPFSERLSAAGLHDRTGDLVRMREYQRKQLADRRRNRLAFIFSCSFQNGVIDLSFSVIGLA